MKSNSSKRALVLVLLTFVVIAGLGMVYANGHTQNESVSASILSGSNPVNLTLNVTVSGLEYSDQPNQWFFSEGMNVTPSEQITKSGDWVLNNSGYQVFYNNSSASAQSSPSIAQFSLGQNLTSNVSYIVEGSNFALNGTGTFYLILSATSNSAIPPATNQTGASGEMVFLKAVYSSGVYDLTLGYYANTTGVPQAQSITGTLQPLQFYTAELNVQSSGTQLMISQLGTQVAQSTVIESPIQSLLNSNLKTTENLYSAYEFLSGAGGKNTSMILNYAFLVDHNVYNYPAPSAPYYEAAPVMGGSDTLTMPFDPSVSNNTTFIQNMNSTSYGNFVSSPTVNLNQFSNITNQNSSSASHANFLNSSYVVSNLTSGQTMNATQAYATTSLSPQVDNSVSAQIQVSSYSSANVATQLGKFLQNYASGQFSKSNLNVPASQVTILNYVITEMGLDLAINNATETNMQNYFYNSYASDLQASNYSLVNTTTSAIVAGAFAGDFYDGGAGAVPLIHNGLITNWVTGQSYTSLASAGFPQGSYISQGSALTGATIIVPQLTLLGYSANGNPIFSASGFTFPNILGGLTSAGKAVQSFFTSAKQNVANAITTVAKKTVAPLIDSIKPTINTISSDWSRLRTNVATTISHIAPAIGGTTQKLSSAITNTLGGISSKLSQITRPFSNVASDIVSSVATGVKHVKVDLTRIGDRISANMDPVHITNVLGKIVNDSKAVLSPLFTNIKTLGSTVVKTLGNVTGSIAHTVTNAVKSGINAIDTTGQNIEKLTTGSVQTVSNALGSAKQAIVNAGGKVSKGASSVWNAFASFGNGIKNNIVTYLAITGGIVIVIVIAYIFLAPEASGAKAVTTGAKKL